MLIEEVKEENIVLLVYLGMLIEVFFSREEKIWM